jgi:cell division protein FtsW
MSTLANIKQRLKGDRMIWVILLLLSVASLLAVYSASGSMAYKYESSTEYYFVRQLAIILISFVAAYGIHNISYTFFQKLAPILYVVAMVLLFITMIWGVEINEARRWIRIPLLGFTIQTSDFAKVALIIFVAQRVAEYQDQIHDLKIVMLKIVLPILFMCALIIPSDLSTALMMFTTCLIILFVGRMALLHMGVIVLGGVLLVSVIMVGGTLMPNSEVRSNTWIKRIQDFTTGGSDTYQIDQAKIAIAAGGLTGLGPGNSQQRNFLPYAYADFIYAIICEEYGLVGGFIIVVIYLYFLGRCIRVVTRSTRTFAALLAVGLSISLTIQALLNIAVSVNLVPVTGLTLPMVSMGGTSTLFTAISFGIILSVSHFTEQQRKEMEREERLALEGGHLDIKPDPGSMPDESHH